MAKLNELIYNIRTLVRDNKSDDLQFTDRQIAFWIRTLRTKLILEKLARGRQISENNSQSLGTVEVEEVDLSTDTNLPLSLDCNILRSKKRIPTLIEWDSKPLITSLRGLNIKSRLILQHKAQALRNIDNKYTKNMITAFIEDNYLYILGCSILDHITIEGIFEDPIEAHDFNNPDDPFDYDEDYFPIDQSLIDLITELIITKNLQLYFRLPEDRANDAQTAY